MKSFWMFCFHIIVQKQCTINWQQATYFQIINFFQNLVPFMHVLIPLYKLYLRFNISYYREWSIWSLEERLFIEKWFNCSFRGIGIIDICRTICNMQINFQALAYHSSWMSIISPQTVKFAGIINTDLWNRFIFNEFHLICSISTTWTKQHMLFNWN